MGVIEQPEGDVIISSGPLIGLGDIALYSTLAERFHNLGRKVYVDQDNTARNDETLELFWGLNPYIIGPSDKKPNAGYARQGRFYDVANRFPIGSIAAMERAHGLPPPYSIAPKIYYETKPPNIDVTNAVLVDYSAVSSNLSVARVQEEMAVMRRRFYNAPLIGLTFNGGVAPQGPAFTSPTYQVNSVYDYLDLLAHCRAWIGSEAGGQSLAAAVRGEHEVYEVARPEVVCLIFTNTFNSRGYTYRGVDYRAASVAPGE